MLEQLSRILFLVGALPFVILGGAHVFLTFRDVHRPTALSPARPELRQAMAESALLLTSRTNMWLAWLGFNLSHGLGAAVFGVMLLIIGLEDFRLAMESRLLMPVAVAVAGAYLALALKFWFDTPAWGIGLGLACLLLSWVSGLVASFAS